MSKPLVIVESPAKVRTIKKYLGNDYNVAATIGHIKDLPRREMGIDVDNGFAPEYTTIPGKQAVIQALKKAAGAADDIYLAPDPDREGEAIAWHTAEVLKKKGRSTASCFTSSPRTASGGPSPRPRTSTVTSTKPSRRAGSSTGWWGTRCRRCCGARSKAD
jgi:hypothetical protein